MARARGRIELYEPGIKQLLKSNEVGRVVEREGDKLAATATGLSINSDAVYDVRRWTGRDRQRVHVGTGNIEAMRAEARERSLTRAAYMLRGRR